MKEKKRKKKIEKCGWGGLTTPFEAGTVWPSLESEGDSTTTKVQVRVALQKIWMIKCERAIPFLEIGF